STTSTSTTLTSTSIMPTTTSTRQLTTTTTASTNPRTTSTTTTSTTATIRLCRVEFCDDGDPCTVDSCDLAMDCGHRPVTPADVVQMAPDVKAVCSERVPRSVTNRLAAARHLLSQAQAREAAGKGKKALKLMRKALGKLNGGEQALAKAK